MGRFEQIRVDNSNEVEQMNMNLLIALIIAVVIGIAGCSTDSQTRQGEPLVAAATVISTQATIVRVNQKTREVTLEVPNKPGDNFVDVRVSDDVKNLSQMRTGDRVTVSYIEAVVVDLFQPGEVEPGIRAATVTGTAKPGQRPAGVAAEKLSVVAVIEAINTREELVTLRGPEGMVKTVKVNNPAILDRLKVGDKVKTTLVRGLAITVTPSSVR
jgi:undecaprenyl pyrophosphate phosphatase UppP